jgi:pimeloyl-ACP methyl ester carboxylesterase
MRVALAIGLLLLAGAGRGVAARPIVGGACLTKAERAHTLRFESRSGATVAGVLLGSGPVGIVFAHQSPGDLCDWMFYARAFEAKGYVVLPFDMNGFGASTVAPTSPTRAYWDRDVAAAAGVLRGHGVRKVVLIGASLGGTVVVAAAAGIKPAVSAVVDLSGPTESSGVDAVAAARRLRVPVQYVVADDDAYIADVRQTYRATPPRLRRLLVVTGGGHGVGLLLSDLQPHARQTRAVIEAFIRRHTRG